MDTIVSKLTLLFEVRMQYRQSQTPISLEGRVGEYIGSGDGGVMGKRIQGHIVWDLFEKVGDDVCDAHFSGVIITDDGAEIRFNTLGFFRPPSDGSNIWRQTASVVFTTDSPEYHWLTETVGVWDGEFDMGKYKHHYHVYTSEFEQPNSTNNRIVK